MTQYCKPFNKGLDYAVCAESLISPQVMIELITCIFF